MMQTYMLFGIIPTVLILLTGLLILRTGEPQTGRRRFLLFLLTSAALMLLILVIVRQLPAGQGPPFLFGFSSLLTPAILSVLALLILQLKWLPGMSRHTRANALLLALVVVALFALLWGNTFWLDTIIVIPALLLVWVLGRRSGWLAAALGLLALLGLLAFNRFMANPPPDPTAPSALLRIAGLSFFALPGLVVALAAVHLTGALARLRPSQQGNENASASPVRPIAAVVLALLLLAALAYTILWASIWDQTDDGLAGLFLFMSGAHAAIAAGMLMALSLHGSRRLGGILFAILTPLLLLWSFNTGWVVPYLEMTEHRAQRIAEALEQYRQREGRYPHTLQDLAPGDLLWVPQPLIFAGEGWCYEGNTADYRLGAVYRPAFGAPMSVQTYAQTGDAEEAWVCDERLAGLQEIHYSPNFQDMQAQAAEQTAAQATPLPPSAVTVPKKTLSPLTLDPALMTGTWAPDGSYFLYGQPGDGGQFTFFFLERASGDVCQTSTTFDDADANLWSLRERHAWLADGRLLVVIAGQVAAVEPCGDLTMLEDAFPEPSRRITAAGPPGAPLLLEGETSFWLVDKTTLEPRPIDGIAPQQDESQTAHAGWSLSGDRLAISHQSGDDVRPSVSIVDPASAAVTRTLGVSLLSLLDGDLLDFWAFPDDEHRIHPYPILSPDGKAAVVTVDLLGLYFMQLEDD